MRTRFKRNTSSYATLSYGNLLLGNNRTRSNYSKLMVGNPTVLEYSVLRVISFAVIEHQCTWHGLNRTEGSFEHTAETAATKLCKSQNFCFCK